MAKWQKKWNKPGYEAAERRAHALAATGKMNIADIAREVGVSRQCICNWLSPAERARIPVYRRRASAIARQWTPETLAELAERAGHIPAEQLSEEYELSISALNATLKRYGYPPVKVGRASSKRIPLSQDDLAYIDMWHKSGMKLTEIAPTTLTIWLGDWRALNGVPVKIRQCATRKHRLRQKAA